MKRQLFTMVVCVALVVAAAVFLYATVSPAQSGAAFSDPDRAEMWISGNARKMRIILERRLTQAQIDILESKMFPAPTNDEKRSALQRVRRALKDAGFLETDSAILAIDGELAKVPTQ